jgi:hypothetical protein
LVLSADVIAHEESFEPLLKTLRMLLCSPNAGQAAGRHALIANKCRDEAEYAFWEHVLEDFHIEAVHCGVSELNKDGDELPITVYRLVPRVVPPHDNGGQQQAANGE